MAKILISEILGQIVDRQASLMQCDSNFKIRLYW